MSAQANSGNAISRVGGISVSTVTWYRPLFVQKAAYKGV
jgi:hypothetical protein